MAWINWVPEDQADGALAESYRRHGRRGGVDHILKIHSLDPETIELHYRYYEHLMRGSSPLSLAEREMIAVTVSASNECFY